MTNLYTKSWPENLARLGVDERITLEWMLKKLFGSVLIEFIWLRIGIIDWRSVVNTAAE
jgi:hypothetical protein